MIRRVVVMLRGPALDLSPSLTRSRLRLQLRLSLGRPAAQTLARNLPNQVDSLATLTSPPPTSNIPTPFCEPLRPPARGAPAWLDFVARSEKNVVPPSSHHQPHGHAS